MSLEREDVWIKRKVVYFFHKQMLRDVFWCTSKKIKFTCFYIDFWFSRAKMLLDMPLMYVLKTINFACFISTFHFYCATRLGYLLFNKYWLMFYLLNTYIWIESSNKILKFNAAYFKFSTMIMRQFFRTTWFRFFFWKITYSIKFDI